ncbi:glutaminase [Alicyclobacillaceae bacterium I2511]|nr:glutaminase [Alicyclobacillaceae bacterium I2511]
MEKWVTENKAYGADGAAASYIPALQNVNASALGICLIAADDVKIAVGDWNTPFTLQSVSKVINFLVACESRGIDTILRKVDVEPTGDTFDSIIRLEIHKPDKLFNPMINAGAITVASMLPGVTAVEKLDVFMSYMEKILGKRPPVNRKVYESEWANSERNRALAHYLKGLGYLESDVLTALEVYIGECAVEVNTEDLATIGLILSQDGYNARVAAQILSKQVVRITKSLMMTCGMYNASGKMAAFIGIPAKSGVSGGILATVPTRARQSDNPFASGCGIGIYGPAINEVGNSVAGTALLQRISEAWDLSIF